MSTSSNAIYIGEELSAADPCGGKGAASQGAGTKQEAPSGATRAYASGAAAPAVDRGANVAPGRWLVSDEAAAAAPVPAPASKLLINAVPELGLYN